MYCLIIEIGAPHNLQQNKKEPREHPLPHNMLGMEGYFFFRIRRPDTPFRELTERDIETLGG